MAGEDGPSAQPADGGDHRSEGPRRVLPTARQIQRQKQLPFRSAVRIAWRNIRVRIGRSLLVMAGIVLAVAFLTYLMCSDAVWRSIAAGAPERLLEQLRRAGKLPDLTGSDARIQTWWVLGLALLVSFVGILNAMLLSVTERFAEIGTMKCLGALDSLIVRLFLLESAFQGVIGTAVGVLVGLIVALAEALVACGGALWSLLPWATLGKVAGLGLLAGTALTVAGALYPAWRAAKMRPVEAMRLEV